MRHLVQIDDVIKTPKFATAQPFRAYWGYDAPKVNSLLMTLKLILKL